MPNSPRSWWWACAARRGNRCAHRRQQRRSAGQCHPAIHAEPLPAVQRFPVRQQPPFRDQALGRSRAGRTARHAATGHRHLCLRQQLSQAFGAHHGQRFHPQPTAVGDPAGAVLFHADQAAHPGDPGARRPRLAHARPHPAALPARPRKRRDRRTGQGRQPPVRQHRHRDRAPAHRRGSPDRLPGGTGGHRFGAHRRAEGGQQPPQPLQPRAGAGPPRRPGHGPGALDLPGQHEPRNPHPAQWLAGHARPVAGRAAEQRTTPAAVHRPRLGQGAGGPAQTISSTCRNSRPASWNSNVSPSTSAPWWKAPPACCRKMPRAAWS